jgi:hypothetical protein
MSENDLYKNIWNLVGNNAVSTTDKDEKNNDSNELEQVDENDNRNATIILFEDEKDHIKEVKQENIVEEIIDKDNKVIDAETNQAKEMKYNEKERNNDKININDTKKVQKEIIRQNFNEKNRIVDNQKIQFNNNIINQQNENSLACPKLNDEIKSKNEDNPPLLNGNTQINDTRQNNDTINSRDDSKPVEFNNINDFSIKEKNIYSDEEQLPDFTSIININKF